jgi:hypothetical protein
VVTSSRRLYICRFIIVPIRPRLVDMASSCLRYFSASVGHTLRIGHKLTLYGLNVYFISCIFLIYTKGVCIVRLLQLIKLALRKLSLPFPWNIVLIVTVVDAFL